MANTFLNLPAPAPIGDGPGAAVDVSALAAMKTIVVSGDLVGQVNIEINNDAAAATGWQTVASFQNTGNRTIYVVAKWMRVNIVGRKRGTPAVNVGAVEGAVTLQNLPVTAGDGSGAAVDMSAEGVFKTIQVADDFRGVTIIDVSEDGATDWAQIAAVQNADAITLAFCAKWMRVTRSGVPVIAPGLPAVNVASTNDVGGGGASINVDSTMSGTGSASSPLSVTGADITLTNNSGAPRDIGSPVYIAAADVMGLAKADAAATSRVVGLCTVAFGPADTGKIRATGVLELTAPQWDNICGTAGGLTPNTRYYLSAAAAGKLTSVAPAAAGQSVVPVMVAISATKAIVNPQEPILLS